MWRKADDVPLAELVQNRKEGLLQVGRGLNLYRPAAGVFAETPQELCARLAAHADAIDRHLRSTRGIEDSRGGKHAHSVHAIAEDEQEVATGIFPRKRQPGVCPVDQRGQAPWLQILKGGTHTMKLARERIRPLQSITEGE